MSKHTTNSPTITLRGHLKLNNEPILVIGDPIYLNSKEDGWINSIVSIHQWRTRGLKQAAIHTVDDEHGCRAIVVTDGTDVPQEFLMTPLRGHFAIIEYAGVDSGRMAIANSDGEIAVTGDGNEPDGFSDESRIFVSNTYMGDGLFPVAVWGRDGYVYAFAVITDPHYYDDGWQS